MLTYFYKMSKQVENANANARWVVYHVEVEAPEGINVDLVKYRSTIPASAGRIMSVTLEGRRFNFEIEILDCVKIETKFVHEQYRNGDHKYELQISRGECSRYSTQPKVTIWDCAPYITQI